MTHTTFEDPAFETIYQAMANSNVEEVCPLVEEELRKNSDIIKLIDVLSAGINRVGDKFAEMEVFLPELMMAATAMEEAMVLIQPELDNLGIKIEKSGRVVIGTIQGDVHDIGKKIVGAMLKASGFEVLDLGSDVKPNTFIDQACEFQADAIGVSSLLTTSLPFSKELIKLLEIRNLRDQFKVVMGGAAVTPAYCDSVGADGYGDDASGAIRILKDLIS